MIYLSIIIPVRNEGRFISKTLQAFANQDYPKDRFEIIVVDGRSTDQTRSEVERFIEDHNESNVSLLENPGYLSSCGRNIGVRMARGRLIGIIDGHVYIPNNQLLANMERLKEENSALCLGRPAPLDVPGLKDGKPYWIAIARKTWLGHSFNSFIYSDREGFVDPMSSGFAYDKSVFNRIGYFDESFDGAEDVEFHFRLNKAGILAYTSPDLLIYSYPRQYFYALFKQQIRYGVGRARLVKKHPDGLTKETPIPALVFLFFVLSPFSLLLSLSFPVLYFTYIGGLCLYVLVIMISGSLEAMKRKKVFPGFLVAMGIWTVHMGLGWGFLKTIFWPDRLSDRSNHKTL